MDIEKILNKRSNAVVTDGGIETPKKPTSSQLDNGEIAVNYHKGTERLFIKNDNEEVVEFVSKDEVDKKQDKVNGVNIVRKEFKDDYGTYTEGVVEIDNGVYNTMLRPYKIDFTSGSDKGEIFFEAIGHSIDGKNFPAGVKCKHKKTDDPFNNDLRIARMCDLPSVTPQVQSDWNETNTTSKAYIKNKPTFNTGVTSVGLSMPSTYFTVDSSPITTSGTLTVSLNSGYTIPTTTLLNSFVKCITETVSITEDTLYNAGTIIDQKHVFFVNSTTDTDFVVTIDNSSSSFKTPDGHVLQLTVPADGYAECNFINVNGTIFVRGI